MAGAAQIFFDGVDHVLLSGAELFACSSEPPSDGQDAPPRCICPGFRRRKWVRILSESRDEEMIFVFDIVQP